VVKILQGSVVTQTTLGGLTIYPQVANFLWCICAKKYDNWLAVDEGIAKISRLTFFGPPCIRWSAVQWSPGIDVAGPAAGHSVLLSLLLWVFFRS